MLWKLLLLLNSLAAGFTLFLGFCGVLEEERAQEEETAAAAAAVTGSGGQDGR